MSGVWNFGKCITRQDGSRDVQAGKVKVLVYRPANQIISSFPELEARLSSIGWSRLYPSEQPGTIQFHKSHSSNDLITLPSIDFRSFKPMHLYDIVLKNRHYFQVRDL